MSKEDILSLIDLILQSYVLTDEEKLKWLLALPRIADEERRMLQNVLLQAKDTMKGEFPENLSQEQLDELKPLLEELKSINRSFAGDLFLRKESKSQKEDQNQEEKLLEQLQSL